MENSERNIEDTAKLKRKVNIFYNILYALYVIIVILIPFSIIMFTIRVLFPIGVGRFCSMEPTIYSGDISIYDNNVDNLQRGDIILFKATYYLVDFDIEYDSDEFYTKRIIGLPGETVEIKDGKVYIDSILLEEDYTKGITFLEFSFDDDYDKVIVPENEYYVLGDNREDSNDSRNFGTVLKEKIKGKMLVNFPVGKFFKSLFKKIDWGALWIKQLLK